jgi:hypothetical protein
MLLSSKWSYPTGEEKWKMKIMMERSQARQQLRIIIPLFIQIRGLRWPIWLPMPMEEGPRHHYWLVTFACDTLSLHSFLNSFCLDSELFLELTFGTRQLVVDLLWLSQTVLRFPGHCFTWFLGMAFLR